MVSNHVDDMQEKVTDQQQSLLPHDLLKAMSEGEQACSIGISV